jgi:hypothetical protein
LPLKYRISENWLDIQQFKAKIDMSTDGIALIILGYFLSYMNDVYATLLTPNTLDADAHSILSAVQERALKRALHCSQLAVYALHRLTKIESISQCKSLY